MNHRYSVRLAVGLWLVFACLVWNVVFDRVIVLAGRRYSYDATVRYRTSGAYLHIDDVMRPATTHGVWVASVVAVAIAIVALVIIRLAAVRDARRRPQ